MLTLALLLLSAAYVVFGLWILAPNGWGLVQGRPVVTPTRSFGWVLAGFGLALGLGPLIPLIEPALVQSSRWRGYLFYVALPMALAWVWLFGVWRRNRGGYLIFGAHYSDSFRGALAGALQALGWAYDDSRARRYLGSSIRLPGWGADLRIFLSITMGFAHVRIRPERTQGPDQPEGLNARLGRALAEYYASTPVKVRGSAFVSVILFGLMQFIAAGLFVWMAVWMP